MCTQTIIDAIRNQASSALWYGLKMIWKKKTPTQLEPMSSCNGFGAHFLLWRRLAIASVLIILFELINDRLSLLEGAHWFYIRFRFDARISWYLLSFSPRHKCGEWPILWHRSMKESIDNWKYQGTSCKRTPMALSPIQKGDKWESNRLVQANARYEYLFFLRSYRLLNRKF